MNNTIKLKTMPSAFAVLAKAGTTIFRKGKGELPSDILVIENCKFSEKHIASYNKICYFKDLSYIPATYPYIYTFPLQMELMGMPNVPYPLPGMVHLANSIQLHKVLNIQKSYTVYCHFGDYIHHEKGQAFEIKTKLFEGNELVWECTSIYLYINGKEGKGNAIKWEESLPVTNNMKQSWHLDYTMGMRYAAVNKDVNPIHLFPLSAKLFGMPRHIMHGMWSVGRTLAFHSERENLEKLTINVHFKTPIYLPADIIYRYNSVDNCICFDVVDIKEEKPHMRGSIIL
jgi:hypothetical protein